VIILPELTYFITLMNLFSNLVEGRHEVNIGKCRQVHSYATLMEILKSAGLCYPLKTHLRNYIN
jgi:inositol 1,4,5-triphosphate receptor type 1/inositol 1,4,5-triphosphate receptor type 3